MPVAKEIQVETARRLAGMCDRRNTVSFDLKHGILRQLNVNGKEKEMFLPYLSILFQANAWKTLS